MDNVLKTLVSEFSDISNIYKKAYADDVVFILKQKHLSTFIIAAKKVFQEFGLIFNENKSQVLILKKKNSSKKISELTEFEGLKVVNEYNCLGIRIFDTASMQPHYRYLKQRCAYLQ